MDAAQVGWAVSLVVAAILLPVGVIRAIAYRSGEADHTAGMRFVARLAVTVGTLALAVFVGLTVWFLASGGRPSG
jgi:hypothetical protein